MFEIGKNNMLGYNVISHSTFRLVNLACGFFGFKLETEYFCEITECMQT